MKNPEIRKRVHRIQCGNSPIHPLNDAEYDSELWKSDGTSVGTALVKGSWNGYSEAIASELTNVNGML